MYPGLSRHAYFIMFSFSEFLDFNHFLYLFLVYTVEPCYKAPFRRQISVSWGFFPLLEERWKLGEMGRNKGGFELGEGRGLQLLGGREAVTGCHIVGAVTVAMLHCISKPNEE